MDGYEINEPYVYEPIDLILDILVVMFYIIDVIAVMVLSLALSLSISENNRVVGSVTVGVVVAISMCIARIGDMRGLL